MCFVITTYDDVVDVESSLLLLKIMFFRFSCSCEIHTAQYIDDDFDDIFLLLFNNDGDGFGCCCDGGGHVQGGGTG